MKLPCKDCKHLRAERVNLTKNKISRWLACKIKKIDAVQAAGKCDKYQKGGSL